MVVARPVTTTYFSHTAVGTDSANASSATNSDTAIDATFGTGDNIPPLPDLAPPLAPPLAPLAPPLALPLAPLTTVSAMAPPFGRRHPAKLAFAFRQRCDVRNEYRGGGGTVGCRSYLACHLGETERRLGGRTGAPAHRYAMLVFWSWCDRNGHVRDGYGRMLDFDGGSQGKLRGV